MNPNFIGYMSNGGAYKSHLGIMGIQAAKAGIDAFNSFANALDVQIGQASQRTHVSGTESLPTEGYLLYPTMAMLFSTGAERASHGSMVLGGMVDTYNDPLNPVYNVRVTEAVRARWSTILGTWPGRIRDAYVFGHSYGGVVAECFADTFSRTYPSTYIKCETYGAPRAMISSRRTFSRLWQIMRNINITDVVSHIPYHTAEAPLSSRITPTTIRTAFDSTGHTTETRMFSANGTYIYGSNNVMPVEDTSLSMLLWVSYANHITSRDHELATYVAIMTAFALRDEYGVLPAATTTAVPPVSVSPPAPTLVEQVTGVALTPAELYTQILAEEQAAAALYFSIANRQSARGIRVDGVSGVHFLGQVRVSASSLRSAKRLAKRLNKLRRLMGPLATDQRAEMLAALLSDIEGV